MTLRVDHLRHTFVQRLPRTGVFAKDRSTLPGYAAATTAGYGAMAAIERLIKMASKVLF